MKRALVVLLTIGALAVPTAAVAQSATDGGYGSDEHVTKTVERGGLAHTGLDIGLLLAAGFGLLGTGLVLRRVSAGA